MEDAFSCRAGAGAPAETDETEAFSESGMVFRFVPGSASGADALPVLVSGSERRGGRATGMRFPPDLYAGPVMFIRQDLRCLEPAFEESVQGVPTEIALLFPIDQGDVVVPPHREYREDDSGFRGAANDQRTGQLGIEFVGVVFDGAVKKIFFPNFFQ